MVDGMTDDDRPLLDFPDGRRAPVTASEVAAGATAATGTVVDPEETPIERAAETAMRAEAARREGLPQPESTRVLVVANQKGGVGKTTSAVNLAAALAICDLRVLVIDMDPQGNASTALDVEHRAGTPSTYDVLLGESRIDDVVRPVARFDRLDCVPATIDLAGAEIELVQMEHRESRLREVLAPYVSGEGRRYDYILIDCPPSLGLLTVNALVGGDEVLIPIQCEYYALEGLSALLTNIKLVQAHLNPSLVISTILLTMFDGRTRLAAQVVDEVRNRFGRTVLDTVVPRSVRISEAPSYGETVMTYDASSSGAMSYLEAAREIALRAERRVPAGHGAGGGGR